MALPMIRKLKPDLLITDIKMPFMDGLSLSEIVKEEFPKIKIIIISGYDDFEYAQWGIRVGLDNYLLKPIDEKELETVALEVKRKHFFPRVHRISCFVSCQTTESRMNP